jgi:heptosyltransferase II
LSDPPIHPNTRTLAIVLPSWIGDTVMATPVLRAVRAALPNVRIIGVMRGGLDDILCGTPWLDEMVVCDGKWAGQIRRCLRRVKPEAALLLPNSFRSALGARFCGARVRAGYDRDGRGWLLTHRKPLRVPKHAPIPAVDYYAELTEWALGLERIDRHIELAVTDEEDRAADQLLHDLTQPFVLLNPGANRADKRWSAERFGAAADRLATSHRVQIVITGSPGERDVLASVQRAAKTPIVNLSERGITLGSLKAVIKRAAVVITNDTGPRHIAAALGTPVVTLFGPTDHRWTTLHDVRERILLAEPFLPEELVADRFPKACAIVKIAVGDVVYAAESLFDDSKAREAASG